MRALPTLRLVLGLSILAAPSAARAQRWTSIVAGKTTADELVSMIGRAEAVEPSSDGVIIATWSGLSDARSLRVAIDAEHVVQVFTVVPMSRMTEADVMSLYGTLRKSLGVSGSGLRLIAYPIGGAQAEYDNNENVMRLTVNGGVASKGLSVGGLLRSLISGKKPPQ